MKRLTAFLFALIVAVAIDPAAAQPPREVPYWASINSGRAMMRSGPGQNYPGQWLYVRPDLPIRVIEIYQSWRRIEDPDGTTGWMLVSLLSGTRTALVRGNDPAPMYESADGSSPVQFRAAPGVVGRISRCAGGWCRFDAGGRVGYIRTDRLWGVGRDEAVG